MSYVAKSGFGSPRGLHAIRIRQAWNRPRTLPRALRPTLAHDGHTWVLKRNEVVVKDVSVAKLPGEPAWTAQSLVQAYERVRPRLPRGGGIGRRQMLPDLGPLANRYDVFVFDAFGVLNAGDRALPSAPARWRELRASGRTLLVVSNAASLPKPALCAKYQAMGFDILPDELVSSRDTLLEALRLAQPRQWGVLAPAGADLSDLPVAATLLGDDPRAYARAEGFLWLGSAGWSAERQAMLRGALREWPRPLWVANPDLVAPRDQPGARLLRHGAGSRRRCRAAVLRQTVSRDLSARAVATGRDACAEVGADVGRYPAYRRAGRPDHGLGRGAIGGTWREPRAGSGMGGQPHGARPRLCAAEAVAQDSPFMMTFMASPSST